MLALLTLDRSFSMPWLFITLHFIFIRAKWSSDNPPLQRSEEDVGMFTSIRLSFYVPVVPSTLSFLVFNPHTPPTNKQRSSLSFLFTLFISFAFYRFLDNPHLVAIPTSFLDVDETSQWMRTSRHARSHLKPHIYSFFPKLPRPL